MRRFVLLLGLLFTLPMWAQGNQAPAPDWKPLSFLVGNWAADASSTQEGRGAFSFQLDLQGQIMVRKNFAEYPAQKQKSAYRHDDLMVIFQEGIQRKAIYFDSEGHTIHYAVQPGSDGLSVTFLSAAEPGVPRYRLTYHWNGERLEGRFEIAPPGKPDSFSLYLQWTAHRN